MATLEEQEVTGNLMRRVNDAHYKLSLALFKFHAMVSYLDAIPEEFFVEVETAIKEVEEVLSKCRAELAMFVHGEMCDPDNKLLF